MEQNFLLDAFFKGGAMMWPLLICSLIALGVILERVWTLARVPDESTAEAQLVKLKGCFPTRVKKHW